MILEIKIWDTTIGALFYDDSKHRTIFQYDNNFIGKGLPISPILMPLIKNKEYSFPTLPQETFKNLPPTFADSLPDKFGSDLINKWLQLKGRKLNDLNPLEKLSYVGVRGMGALEYFPVMDGFNRTDKSEIEIAEIVDIAKRVLNNRSNSKFDEFSLQNILSVGTSAGGARAKAVIAMDKKTGKVYAGDVLHKRQGVTYYLMKIDDETPNQLGEKKYYGKIEYAYHKMAKMAGIDMMPAELHLENGRAHFITERFDRVNGEKLHMQTLCGIANMDYNNPLIHSYQQAFRVMQQLSLAFSDIKQQYARMVFNMVSRNLDDHTKNISFLMDKQGKWRLSPAYDITFSYNPDSLWLSQHQMSVNGKRNDINYSDLDKMGIDLGIRNRKSIIEQVIDSVSQWQNIADKVGVSKGVIKEIERNLLYKKI